MKALLYFLGEAVQAVLYGLIVIVLYPLDKLLALVRRKR